MYKKYYYRVYGLILESDYELPQMISVEPTGNADIKIIYDQIDESIKEKAKGFSGCFGDSEVWFCNTVGVFWIHDNSTINFVECEGKSIDDAGQYLSGLCLSILLWYRKMIMIHGSCLRYLDKTIIVAGDSGSGKSTLTNELIKRGALLIADDVTGIRKADGIFYSYPAFPVQKLCMDQVENNNLDVSKLRQVRYDDNKYEIPRTEVFYDSPSKVDVMFVLDKGEVEELETQKIDGADKIKHLTDKIFIRWMFNEDFKFDADDMLRCVEFANGINMFSIIREPEHNTLGKILEYVDNQLK